MTFSTPRMNFPQHLLWLQRNLGELSVLYSQVSPEVVYLNYFSVAMKRHDEQDNLQKKELLKAYGYRVLEFVTFMVEKMTAGSFDTKSGAETLWHYPKLWHIKRELTGNGVIHFLIIPKQFHQVEAKHSKT